MKKLTSQHNFQVVYQLDEDGLYVARVPALPGCHTQGKTLEQAQSRVKEAIQAYLESLAMDKKSLPTHGGQTFLGMVTV